MYQKRRKLKKEVIIGGIILLVIIIASIFAWNYFRYQSSTEFKLKEMGYEEEEIETLFKYLKEDQIKPLLKKHYNRNIPKLIIQKYFIYENLDRYTKYMDQHASINIKTAIGIINVNADYDPYTHTTKTDMSKKNLILTNKYNYLEKNYQPKDLVEITNKYAYDDNLVREEVDEMYRKMWADANREGLKLIANSSFRSYEDQDKVWKRYKLKHDQEWADSYAARAGFSEHQTGLAMDIATYNSILDDFEQTEEFKWLQKNAHKYGFILRYPKDKENITGYQYEPWHYRYVGIKVAKEIYNANITFDEYYAYYLAR